MSLDTLSMSAEQDLEAVCCACMWVCALMSCYLIKKGTLDRARRHKWLALHDKLSLTIFSAKWRHNNKQTMRNGGSAAAIELF